MADRDDLLAKLALEMNLVTEQEIQDCRNVSSDFAKLGGAPQLGSILLARGYLSAQQVETLNRLMDRESNVPEPAPPPVPAPDADPSSTPIPPSEWKESPDVTQVPAADLVIDPVLRMPAAPHTPLPTESSVGHPIRIPPGATQPLPAPSPAAAELPVIELREIGGAPAAGAAPRRSLAAPEPDLASRPRPVTIRLHAAPSTPARSEALHRFAGVRRSLREREADRPRRRWGRWLMLILLTAGGTAGFVAWKRPAWAAPALKAIGWTDSSAEDGIGRTPGPDRAPATNAAPAEPTPAESPGPAVPVEIGTAPDADPGREALAAARAAWTENPSDPAAALARFRGVAEAFRDAPSGRLAAEEIERIESALEREAAAAWEQVAAGLEGGNDLTADAAALDAILAFERGGVRTALGERIGEARAKVIARARDRVAEPLREAEALAAAGDFAKARDRLAPFLDAPVEPVRADIAARIAAIDAAEGARRERESSERRRDAEAALARMETDVFSALRAREHEKAAERIRTTNPGAGGWGDLRPRADALAAVADAAWLVWRDITAALQARMLEPVTLRRRDGAVVAGKLIRADAAGVTLRTDQGPAEIALTDVTGVSLTEILPAPPAADRGPVLLRRALFLLADGDPANARKHLDEAAAAGADPAPFLPLIR